LDVDLEPQRVAERLLREPDQVVVLVLGAGDVAGLFGRDCHCSSAHRRITRSRCPYPHSGARMPSIEMARTGMEWVWSARARGTPASWRRSRWTLAFGR